MGTLIKNAKIVNEGNIIEGDLLIEKELISKVAKNIDGKNHNIIDANECYLIPGVIDDQVHFREPGLTHKANIFSESRAAVAGGITSYMEMPNTIPQTLTKELLEQKIEIGKNTSLANFSFFFGASNDNLEEVLKIDFKTCPGLKIFMGSSTGNMLVDDFTTLNNIFSKCKGLIATHCEDEETIQKNISKAKVKFGQNIPFDQHPIIRSREACFKSSDLAVSLAKKYNTRLHVLHISTKEELDLFTNQIPLEEKRITSEVCVHHLSFTDEDYKNLGSLIKWNPAVKTKKDNEALWKGLLDNRLDIIATDHAPHTISEKQNKYLESPSGGPLVQHSLPIMLEHMSNGKIKLEELVNKMCHAPAKCFKVNKRGYIKEGYYADLVLFDKSNYEIAKHNLLYKCGWSPFEGRVLKHKITHTFINGNLVYKNGKFNENKMGSLLTFNS